MTILFEERASDSPYLATVTRGQTVGNGTSLRPAENHWHMVLRRLRGDTHLLIVGPWTTAGLISYDKDAELLWIKLKLGTYMPHLPTRGFLNSETVLPDAAKQTFWLKGSAWQFPTFENTEFFVKKLAREGVLAYDPVIGTALQGHPIELASRTVRHRFLHVTGLTQKHIRQLDRAKRAEALLQQGVSILDTVDEAGYFDQPHLTRSLKHWVGYTPAQISRRKDRELYQQQSTGPIAFKV